MSDAERNAAEHRINYLIAAIADTQGIIRALDAKASVLTALLFVPIYGLDVTKTVFTLPQSTDLFPITASLLLLSAFAGAWVLSLCAALSSLAAIDNPAHHIKKTDTATSTQALGFFYLGGEFSPGLARNLFSTRNLSSKSTLDQILAQCPSTPDAIINDLVFENFKVAYIRDLKAIRLKAAFLLTSVWIGVGIAAVLLAGN